MMEFVHVAIVVFSLLSLGQSAPVTNCESLTKPIKINGTDQLLGRWNYVGWSTNMVLGSIVALFAEPGWLHITATDQHDLLITSDYLKMFDTCETMISNMTLKNNTFITDKSTVSLLTTTCPDCLVQYSTGPGSERHLEFLSRRTAVTDAELEEFKKQVECLNLRKSKILDPKRELCPVQSATD
ncbi:uncharacterized protein LOC105920215 isoform X2 [Fundulus heteroclitus]|uniref:uncharacterized protein LOC105920215 isoform X2 n=1 Tax=Fundulus heteroclitus TaxID=8078 RepID=UPI00165B19E9|nr:uncharacterized protein LOC105920215 isoform X2 [Fundulus heteroclitus]